MKRYVGTGARMKRYVKATIEDEFWTRMEILNRSYLESLTEG